MNKLAMLLVVLTGMALMRGCENIAKNVENQRAKCQKEIDATQHVRAEKPKEIDATQHVRVEKPKHDKLDAFAMAQDFVESNLKCPRTAKWPWISYSEVTVHLGSGKYQISSYLDAQNGFGALVRIHFICIVQHVGGSNWRLVKLVM